MPSGDDSSEEPGHGDGAEAGTDRHSGPGGGSGPDPDPDQESGREPQTPVEDGGATVEGEPEPEGKERHGNDYINRFGDFTDLFINTVEILAAGVFAVLFAIGVADLILQIVDAVQNGNITNPLVVISFIDTGLLLLIIVEVYQTVIAYTREEDTQVIVRLVIYTGVIAMVRKVIVFRTSEYQTEGDALLVALSYATIIVGLVGLLLAERAYSAFLEGESNEESRASQG